jgi:tRNA threonylcarbamoyladenosine biosynthesis protein TsaB
MNVLAIDTASPSPAVALLVRGRLFEEPLPSDRRASEELLPAVQRVLAASGARLEDCGRLAVCSGPGSFTGTRIGLATAWGLGRALSIPVEPVSTLEAMAEAARPEAGALVTAVLDAGRGELVLQQFALEGPRARPLSTPERVPREEAAERARTGAWITLPPTLLPAQGGVLSMRVASGLALAVARAPRLDVSPPMKATYSRPSAAEEKRGAS